MCRRTIPTRPRRVGGTRICARIAECGLEARFRDDIAATLRASDLLPMRYQE
ncbi:MAG: hypothetical protein JKP98_05605 [Rhodobacteraceae bacterium]|nr:hypothetical protein [Paracoccaceae bacterium]